MTSRSRLVAAAALVACVAVAAAQRREPARSASPAMPIPQYDYRVVNVYPHDPGAFTQGLLYLDGVLYESTGLEGESSVRRVKLETGEVLQHRAVPRPHFAEGLALVGDSLVQLTWKSGVGFVYDRRSFEIQRTFAYRGEGWGLTTDGTRVLMSDGSDRIRILDPSSLAQVGTLLVRDPIRPMPQLNELEMVKGVLYANVWPTDEILMIDPKTGRVVGRLDMSWLLAPAYRTAGVDVLNGIAYDAMGDRLFVTGKRWPRLFEIKVRQRGPGA